MADVDAKVKKIISEQLGVPEGDVKPEASFVNDLACSFRYNHQNKYNLFRCKRWDNNYLCSCRRIWYLRVQYQWRRFLAGFGKLYGSWSGQL